MIFRPKNPANRTLKISRILLNTKSPRSLNEPRGLLFIGVFLAFSFWFGLWALAHNS
jgi:hypothetical protein